MDNFFSSYNGGSSGGGGMITSVFGRTGVVVAVAGDYNASQITFTPVGGISATDVQAAIAEVDSEKANITLNNLGTTAVNADILSDGTGTHDIGSFTNYFATIRAGNMTVPSTGFISVSDFTDGPGNGILTLGIRTGPGGFTNAAGIASAAGTITESWRTLLLMSRNRNDATLATGSVLLNTGNNTLAGGSGFIQLRTGTTAGTRGAIFFQNGTEGTSGHVWTSNNTVGRGVWAAIPAAGANTALSNLASTSINADLNPNASSTYSLGVGLATRWLNIWVDDVRGINTVGVYDGTGPIGVLQATITPSGAGSGDGVFLRGGPNTAVPGQLDTGVLTRNSATVATGALYVETGNQTGTSNSGLINIKTGVASQSGSAQDSGLVNIETGETDNGNSGDITQATGFTNTGISGAFSLLTGTANNGTSGDMVIASGEIFSTGSSGLVSIRSGTTNLSASGNVQVLSGVSVTDSGLATFGSGNVTSGTSGLVSVKSGDASAGSSSEVQVFSGNAPAGTSGNIRVTSGTATSTTDRGGLLLELPFINIEHTNTAAATTGDQTIHKSSGTVNFAAAATTLVVTNDYVTTDSIIFAVIRTNDATAVLKNVVPAAGSFTIRMATAPTAETSVGFFVINF